MRTAFAPPGRAQKFPREISRWARISSSLVGDQALEQNVLLLQLLQPLRVVDLHPAVLGPPTVEGDLGDLQGLRDLGDRLALSEHPLGLPQLPDDLVGSVRTVRVLWTLPSPSAQTHLELGVIAPEDG